jgi:KUP system potassium uptake protein
MFRSSDNLASAYGLAVSSVELMTSIAMFDIAYHYWRLNRIKALALFIPFVLIDSILLTSNSLKFFEGGFIPLTIGFFVLGLMLIWKWGRKTVRRKFDSYPSMTVRKMIEIKKRLIDLHTAPHSVIVLTGKQVKLADDKIPVLKQIIWERYKSMSKHIILLNVSVKRHPHVPSNERFEIYTFYEDQVKGSVVSVQVNFGFMEELNVEKVLDRLAKKHLIHIPENHKEWVIEAMHERIHLKSVKNIFDKIRFAIFKFILRNTETADQYFGLGNKSKLAIEVFPINY